MKIAILTDSTAAIPKEERERLNIEMIPLNVIFGEESFQEEVELTANDLYEKIKGGGDLPKSSQPAIGLFVETFEKLAKEGYDAVFSIHLSSGISGTFQTAVSAGDMVEGIKVYPYDSEISALMQGFYAIEAAEMANAGKNPDQILDRLDEMKKSMSAYIMVDDLSHLQRGGRIGGAQAFFGGLLQVKPILTIKKTIEPVEKVRTKKKALKRISDLFGENIKGAEKVKAVVIHGNRQEEAESLKQQVEQEYPNAEIVLSELGPVLATHLGEGTLALGWYIVK